MHTITLTPVTTRTDRSPFYRWSCSCGTASPTLFGFKSQATQAHSDHAQAKRG